MALDGKQIKTATITNAKLATASNTASADSVVLSKADAKIDLSFIPVDELSNFSYNRLDESDTITVVDGQTMLFTDVLDISDGTLVVDGVVADAEPELINLRPWAPTLFGAGLYDLKVGKINKYNRAVGGAMTLHLPADAAEGDVVELKEVGDSSRLVTLTTASGATKIESVTTGNDVASVALSVPKLCVSYKWDAQNATWRLVSSVTHGGGGASNTLTEDQLATLSTSSDGSPVSAEGLQDNPNTFSVIMVYLNGVLMNHVSYGNKTGSLYFSNDGGATAANRNEVSSGTLLYWNGSVAGFQLQPGWTLKVVYSV